MSEILNKFIFYVSICLLGFAVGWFAKKTDVVVKEVERAEEARKESAVNVQNTLERDEKLMIKNNAVNSKAVKTVTKVVERIKRVANEKEQNCVDAALDTDVVRLLNEQRTSR